MTYSGFTNINRDMYYSDPALFMKQAVVDKYVDVIAYTLGVPRATMNVVSMLVTHPAVVSHTFCHRLPPPKDSLPVLTWLSAHAEINSTETKLLKSVRTPLLGLRLNVPDTDPAPTT